MKHSKIQLQKYSIGLGDRFALEAEAQLLACVQAEKHGVDVIPVWNKSNREHVIVGSDPATVHAAAAAAVKKLGWKKPWHVDADHIRLDTVGRFLACSDFYTIDVADSIGKPASPDHVSKFVARHPELSRTLEIPGISASLHPKSDDVARIAARYLCAVSEVGEIYRHIESAKGEGAFIAEVSMDETAEPQSPLELLIILAALADEQVPLQTIAPKFTGRFNKGVDYVGDIAQFEKEFNDDLCVIAFAVRQYGLPGNLKVSIHSGSDKFSIYGAIRRAVRRHNAGLHIKTAGTTWLEELIGLAESGGDGLALSKDIYRQAIEHVEELCAPYASVIDIDRAKLPSPATVSGWSSEQFAATLRHDPGCKTFNPHVRQLLHVGYKIAAKKGNGYLDMVRRTNGHISRNVTSNLFDRHLMPLFIAKD
jgi:hypothetical protein